jgi:hypothetical protein
MTPVESHDATSAECYGWRRPSCRGADHPHGHRSRDRIIGGRLQIETAWEILRRASTDPNTKMRRMAEMIVRSHDRRRHPADDDVLRAIAPIIGFPLGHG